MKRIHLQEWRRQGDRLILLGPTAHRARNVLRVRRGQKLIATDGTGAELTFTVTAVLPHQVEGMVSAESHGLGESPLRVTLAQTVPRSSRMEIIVQKATELGVSRIVPLLGERSVVRFGGDRFASKLRRWEKIASEAVAQCRRSQAPLISPPLRLGDFLRAASAPLRLVLDPGAGAEQFSRLPPLRPSQVEVIVGPEGGLSPEEVEACRQAGFVALCLGPRVLRTDTAGLVVLSLLQHRWGDLG